MDAYEDQLHRITCILEDAGFSPSVRGEGAARFVYAEHDDRAAELSRDGVGFFIELFQKPAEISVCDYQQDTVEHAADQAVEWLSKR